MTADTGNPDAGTEPRSAELRSAGNPDEAQTTQRYRGTLRLGTYGEGDDILFLGDDGDPLAETISDDIDRYGRYLTVRYWTADAPQGDEEIAEGAIRQLFGEGDARFRQAYSEITGYLWTDEDLNVGGHDLLAELGAQAGRYCLLEISYSPSLPL
jgi:hypothetical protein